MLKSALRALAPALFLAAAPLLTACGQANMNINGEDGVPLAELDMTREVPSKIVLAGPDTVVVTRGEKLAITIDGDGTAKDELRFSLKNGTLGIMRKSQGGWTDASSTVRVTMPNPQSAVVAGSGTLELPGMAQNAGIVIAGSGTATVKTLSARQLSVTVGGAGKLVASGTAETLELTIAGSGEADMRGLQVDRAEVTIAGSGNAAFASDGRVEATIVGSGTVDVAGNATCTIKAMGSGSLNCSGGTRTKTGEAPAAPAAPDAPNAPRGPDTPSSPTSPDAPAPPTPSEN